MVLVVMVVVVLPVVRVCRRSGPPAAMSRGQWRAISMCWAMEGRDWQKERTVAVVRSPVSSRVVYKENT